MMLSGWGNYPREDCRVLSAFSRADLARVVASEPSLIAHGAGRAYGDAALNPRATLLTRGMDRVLAFDPERGRITCEGGVLLGRLLEMIMPLGWFPPVTPGTEHVTVGGMIAADVHGKNHHGAGSFSRHVESLELITGDGRATSCSPDVDRDVFFATCGGMGLTGVIASATFRLEPIETGWVRRQTVRCASLDETLDAIDESGSWTYSAAWIDCLARGAAMGRSILHLGEHARLAELGPAERRWRWGPPRRRPRPIPFGTPDGLLNGLTVRAFNELYFRCGSPGERFVGWSGFFYPLDAILWWNRLYGRSGFMQHQCVLPIEASAAGLRQLLTAVSRAGLGSFLAVLKRLGPAEGGLVSFPMEGFTLALDFPLRRDALPLLDRLDVIVADHGGRLYLAKDARMAAPMLRRGYRELERFQRVRESIGAAGRFSSLLSQRLGL